MPLNGFAVITATPFIGNYCKLLPVADPAASQFSGGISGRNGATILSPEHHSFARLPHSDIVFQFFFEPSVAVFVCLRVVPVPGLLFDVSLTVFLLSVSSSLILLFCFLI